MRQFLRQQYCADVDAERISIEVAHVYPRSAIARLSRKFYERFGDEIAGEFVDWFNALDSSYQQQLRDLNDLNWERFKAELNSAIAQSESRLTEKLFGKFSEMKGDLMKWMFIYWSGTMLSLAGVLIVLLQRR